MHEAVHRRVQWERRRARRLGGQDGHRSRARKLGISSEPPRGCYRQAQGLTRYGEEPGRTQGRRTEPVPEITVIPVGSRQTCGVPLFYGGLRRLGWRRTANGSPASCAGTEYRA